MNNRDGGQQRAIVEDLAMLIRRLVQYVPKDTPARKNAIEYLARHGLTGNLFRKDETYEQRYY